MNQIQQEKVNVQSFQAKYKSKRECYNFLAVDVAAYLPAYETVTIYFLKDIISGSKKCKCIVSISSERPRAHSQSQSRISHLWRKSIMIEPPSYQSIEFAI